MLLPGSSRVASSVSSFLVVTGLWTSDLSSAISSSAPLDRRGRIEQTSTLITAALPGLPHADVRTKLNRDGGATDPCTGDVRSSNGPLSPHVPFRAAPHELELQNVLRGHRLGLYGDVNPRHQVRPTAEVISRDIFRNVLKYPGGESWRAGALKDRTLESAILIAMGHNVIANEPAGKLEADDNDTVEARDFGLL